MERGFLPIGKIWVDFRIWNRFLTDREDFHLFADESGPILPLGKKMTPIHNAIDFGTILARARRGLGLTQRELALAIGVGERFIVDLEAGKPTAQLGKALAAAHAAGMRLADVSQTREPSSTANRS